MSVELDVGPADDKFFVRLGLTGVAEPAQEPVPPVPEPSPPAAVAVTPSFTG